MTIDNIITLVYVAVVLLVNVITMIAVIKKRKNGEVENTPNATEATNQEIEIVKEELNNCLNNIKEALTNNQLTFELATVKKEIKKVLK